MRVGVRPHCPSSWAVREPPTPIIVGIAPLLSLLMQPDPIAFAIQNDGNGTSWPN